MVHSRMSLAAHLHELLEAPGADRQGPAPHSVGQGASNNLQAVGVHRTHGRQGATCLSAPWTGLRPSRLSWLRAPLRIVYSTLFRMERGVVCYGTVWYPGNGAKALMKQHAAVLSAQCELATRDPDSGCRGFMCYPTWVDAVKNLVGLEGGLRLHLNELIAERRPCKPYLDLDLDLETCSMPEGWTQDTVVVRTERAILRIFLEDFSIELNPSSFVWMESHRADKFSMHLVVSSHRPQWVFAENHKWNPEGAIQLALRVVHKDPDLAPFVDLSVYSRDREMRMVGSTKFGKQAVLATVNPEVAYRDTVITWLDDTEVEVIKVPVSIPRTLKRPRSTR